MGSRGRVMLAGGTQMSAVVAILNALHISVDNLCIGTTSYVASRSLIKSCRSYEVNIKRRSNLFVKPPHG